MDINDINKNEDLMLITDNDTFYSIFCVTIKATASGHECVLTFVLFDPKCHPIWLSHYLLLIFILLFQGVVLLDSNGESHDGDSSEADDDKTEPVECSNNFVFVGAEIRTGKSSIRSRQSKRKVSILRILNQRWKRGIGKVDQKQKDQL